jgi:hypothetical protein
VDLREGSPARRFNRWAGLSPSVGRAFAVSGRQVKDPQLALDRVEC